jgi:hypothetical protein
MENVEVEKKLAVNEAVQAVEKERDRLANEVKSKELEKENLVEFSQSSSIQRICKAEMRSSVTKTRRLPV